MIRRPTAAVVAVSALTAATSFFTLLSWDGLGDDATTYLVPLFWVCVGVGAIGLALRSLGTPRLLVPLVQLLVVGVVLLHVWAPEAPAAGWIPTPGALQAAADVLSRAVAESARYPAPVPGLASHFPALLLGSGSLLVVAVDFLACTLRRPPLAGL